MYAEKHLSNILFYPCHTVPYDVSFDAKRRDVGFKADILFDTKYIICYSNTKSKGRCMDTVKNIFYEVYKQIDEKTDQWELCSSHLDETDAEQWIVKLIDENPDYEDINFRIDECVEEVVKKI